MNNLPSVTIGIPTCWSGISLVKAVESIRNSDYSGQLNIIVCADRTPMPDSVRQSLKTLGCKIIWNDKPDTQFKKLNQIIRLSEDKYFIFTQDDVIFGPDTISEIVNVLSQSKDITMTGARILPLKPQNFIESSLASMVYLVDSISADWNKGDNYLAASGRCLAFRTAHLQKFKIPQTILNGDAFLYLQNKSIGGRFVRLNHGRVYIRCPQKLSDQIGPSSRYQTSRAEMETVYQKDLRKEYQIPVSVVVSHTLRELISRPLAFGGYLLIRIYTRLFRKYDSRTITPNWSIDSSTK